MHSAPDHSQSKVITGGIGRILKEGSRGVLATLIQAEKGVGAKLLLTEDGKFWGSFGEAALDEAVRHQATSFLSSRAEAITLTGREFAPALEAFAEARVLFERIEAEPRLVVCGAGHVGASLARLAALVGYRVSLIDDRAEFVRPQSFSDYAIEPLVAESWSDTVQAALGNGRGVSVAIVTRGHKQDEDCLRAVMSNPPDYVGLIGSKRRTNFVLEKLREEGISEEKLKQVRAPIGLDLGAVSPEEVALAILAEIVAERRGGKGAPLSGWRRS